MIRTFYAPPENFHDGMAVLRGEEAHHAARVVRLSTGDRVRIVDGKGHAFRGEVKRVTSSEVAVGIVGEAPSADPGVEVALVVAIPRPQRMDFLIEKSVEIGVSEIFPVIFERTPRLLEGKVLRWRRIAISAMKQCGRATLPIIHPPKKLEDVVGMLSRYSGRFVAHLLDANSLLSYNLPRKAVIAVGPEGGFTETEMGMLERNGFRRFSLGERILRVETAAIVALTIFMAGSGEI